MPKLSRRNGSEVIELSRSEAQRILECKYIVLQVLRNLDQSEDEDEWTLANEFSERAQRLVDRFGAQHARRIWRSEADRASEGG